MMLDYLDESAAARKLENALVEVLAEGKVVTGDLGGKSSTMEMAAEVRSKLEEIN